MATVDDVRRQFRNPPPEGRPMMRWWWFGPSVERDELDRELRAMAAAGLGGVEVAFVYPMGPGTAEFGGPGRWGRGRRAAVGGRAPGCGRFGCTGSRGRALPWSASGAPGTLRPRAG